MQHMRFRHRLGISIHAPREGCDVSAVKPCVWRTISIHAPREGCDDPGSVAPKSPPLFQSTHPVRGATASLNTSAISLSDFNPRTP